LTLRNRDLATLTRRQLLQRSAGAAVFSAATGSGGVRAALLPALPPDGLRFEVIVAGMTSGEHAVDFRSDGERLEVHNRIDIVVSPLGIRLFEYRHRSVETFIGDRLVGFESETVDDDSTFEVLGEAVTDGFEVTGRKGTFLALPSVLVASYWTPAIFTRDVLIDPQRGSLKHQTIHSRDRVTVPVDGNAVEATRYRVSGIITGSIDYDDEDRWLGATFQKKGVDIVYRRVLASPVR
jgi:hypothetical protein